nr:unnamed protein product [Callosobruchus analis]
MDNGHVNNGFGLMECHCVYGLVYPIEDWNILDRGGPTSLTVPVLTLLRTILVPGTTNLFSINMDNGHVNNGFGLMECHCVYGLVYPIEDWNIL